MRQRNHLKVFLGTWLGLLGLLLLTPGFEMRGLIMGLIVGAWPFAFIPWHALPPLLVGGTMLALSAATMGLAAWCLDRARMPGAIWGLLPVALIGGAAVLSRNNITYAQWQATPAVSQAVESPEQNYQPSRSDFHGQVIVPKALAGCMLGLYVATGLALAAVPAVLGWRRLRPGPRPCAADRPHGRRTERVSGP